MAKLIGRLKDGRELWGYDMENVEVKSIGEYEIEIVGSTEDVDRSKEVIEVDGWDLKNFKRNPVILASHRYDQPAIGRGKVKKQDGKLVFRIEFPEEGVYPLADIYRKLYKGGFMRASSVGFIPVAWENGDGEKEPYRTYKKAELLELSLVSVPANPEALITDKGLNTAVREGVITSEEKNMIVNLIKTFVEENKADASKKEVDIKPLDEERFKAKKKDDNFLPPDLTKPDTQSGKEKSAVTVTVKQKPSDNWPEFKDEVKRALQEIFEDKTDDELKSYFKSLLRELASEDLYKQILFGKGGSEAAPDSPNQEKGSNAVKELISNTIKEVLNHERGN